MAIRVLVIDDEREVNETLGQLLTLEGFDYHYAATGEDGLKLAGNLHPDVIVLDAMMPDKTGFEVCRTLKSSRVTCPIPVLFFTCLCGQDHVLRCACAGGQAHVAKPFDFDAVLQVIREADQWHRDSAIMPATGGFRMAANQAETSSKSINQMLSTMILQTAVDDTALAQIGSAFFCLLAATGSLDTANAAAPKLPPVDVQYTIEPTSGMTTLKSSGGGILWTITEPEPGMIHTLQNGNTTGATSAAVSSDRWMRLWQKFIDSVGATAETNLAGAVRLVRRFRTGTMILPADGNVLPFNAFNYHQCRQS
ncbi:MAG: response regulator [Phycisphaerae bacterium]